MRGVPQFIAGLAGGLLGRCPALLLRMGEPRTRERGALTYVVLALALTLGVGSGTVLMISYGAPKPVRLLRTADAPAASGPAGTIVRLLGLEEAEPEPPPATPGDLDAILACEAPPRAWTSIVFHHSATAGGNTASFDRYHRSHHGWRSLGYHFVIGNGVGMPDGSIEAGPRWKAQEAGAHANSHEFNAHGIGVCLVGNFETAPPTKAQIEAAARLARELARRHGISNERIYGHGQIRGGGGTACPGKYFPMDEIRDAATP